MMLKDRQKLSDSAKLIRVLIFCITAVFSLHLINILLGKPSYNFDRFVHLDYESNLPTWFSSMLWVIGAVAAYHCSQRAQVKFEKRFWVVMAAVLLLLSLDEVAMLHEHVFGNMMERVLREFIGHRQWMKWPVLASPFILLVMICLGKGLQKCLVGSRRCGIYLALGGILLVLSSVGLEMVYYFLIDKSSASLVELVETFEETGEMIGALLIICGLLAHREVLEGRAKINT